MSQTCHGYEALWAERSAKPHGLNLLFSVAVNLMTGIKNLELTTTIHLNRRLVKALVGEW